MVHLQDVMYCMYIIIVRRSLNLNIVATVYVCDSGYNFICKTLRYHYH